MDDVAAYYDLLIRQQNDPVYDPPLLRAYMDRWDGPAFVHSLALSGDEAVLEIGVGTGRMARRTAPLCGTFYGIDISPETVRRGKENLAALENVTLICGDYLTYAFDRRFDVIYSTLTFLHIADKRLAVEKTAELLAPGGRFVLSIDQNQSDFIDAGFARIRVYPDDPQQMMALLDAAGLVLRERYETDFATILVAEKAA